MRDPIVILIIILLVAALVSWPGLGPWHHEYGYVPSGSIGIILVVLIAVILLRGPGG